jgi:hypothetical protein
VARRFHGQYAAVVWARKGIDELFSAIMTVRIEPEQLNDQ